MYAQPNMSLIRKTYPSIKTGAMSVSARWIASLAQGEKPGDLNIDI